MLKLLFVLPLLLLLALLPQGTSAPATQTAQPIQAAQPAPPDQAAAPAQASPPDQAAPVDQAAAPAAAVPANNPVKPTAESQAHAAATFKIDCAMCHGENGNGKGDLVSDMGLSMKDLREPATLEGKTDGDIYTIIHDGKGKMPAEGDRAKPDDIWNLVILVRGFAKK
jgi:mono/diheme cytochrome c family protein